MKNSLCLLSILCCFTLSAQAPYSPFQDKAPSVKVQLKGFDPAIDKDLELTFVLVVPTPEHQEENKAKPKADGSFTFQLPNPLRYQQIWFSIGDYYYGQLIVDQGLEVEADLELLKKDPGNWMKEGIQFRGVDGELTEVVNRFVQYRRDHVLEGENKMHIMMDREANLEDKVRRIKILQEKEQKREAEFMLEYPSEANWVLENERISDYYGDLSVIHWSKPMPKDMRNEIMAHQPKLISNASFAYYSYQSRGLMFPTPKETIRNFEQILPARIESEEEKRRMATFVSLLKKKEQGLDYDTDLYKKESKYFFQQYKNQIHHANVDAFAKKTEAATPSNRDFLIALGGGKDIWERTYYVEKMLPKVQGAWTRNLMEKNWAVTKQKILAVNEKLAAIQVNAADSPIGKNLGTLDSGAEFYQAEQAKLEELLGALRSAAGDKAVLLDVWATWCGPCIFDMKQSQPNIEKLDKMGVEVVYICVDTGTNRDTWQKKVTELGLSTKHIFLSTDLSEQIMEYFELKGYPSHVFLDKNGKYHPDVVSSIRNIDFEKIQEKL
ncbi:MAG: TlpA family protein disulfide reductase [Saprospiraceae bacterium]|nr:TlpA family protein disulfide reductase [Saprospiraceae bacterium]